MSWAVDESLVKFFLRESRDRCSILTFAFMQGETVAYTDKYGLIAGGAAAAAALTQKQMKYRQSHGVEYWWPIMRTDAEGLEEICRLASNGRLKIPVGQTFPLEMAAEAHRARDGKNAGGKVVLEIEQKANF